MNEISPPSTDTIDGGEALLQAFERLGVEWMFSSPGSEWAPLWEALARREAAGNNRGPRFVEVWHETLAADMAMGISLTGGGMQAVLLHAAVGLVQGGLGILTARQMEVPMVVMSGESTSFGEDPAIRTEPQWYGYLSDSPERVAAPLAKASRSVGHASTLHGSVLRAGELAQAAPQGPVFLGLPVEHLHAAWQPPEHAPPAPARACQIPDARSIARIAALLQRAENPVIVVESAGRHPGSWEALIALAEAHGLPVIAGRSATYGNFPTAHPLYQGGFGDYAAVREADLVLLISPRTPWSPPGKRPTRAPIVAIGEAILKPFMNYQQLHADFYLEGDVALTLDALRIAADPDGATVAARSARWSQAHERREARLSDEREAACAAGGLNALTVSAALRATVPDDVIWIDETVSHFGTMRHHLPIARPLSLIRAPGGLGQGLGLAIGAKLGHPERPVVALLGDGGFLYNPVVQALGAARDQGAPVLFVVFNNHRYQVMHEGATRFHYPGGALARTGSGHGSAISGFDYERLADLFGFIGLRVETLDDLQPALREGLAATRAGRSAIINIHVDR